MGIDKMTAHVAMPGNMELHDAINGNSVEEGTRIKSVIESVDEDIVDVEQHPAAGSACQLGDEFTFGHLRVFKANISRYVLEGDRSAQHLLHLVDARDDVLQGFARVGDRQEVVQVHPMHARPAEMVRNPLGLDALCERLEAREIVHVEGSGGRNRQGHAMHNYGIARPNLLKYGDWTAAGHHEVLRDDLEPVDRPIAFEDLGVVLRSQSEAEAEIRRPVG